MSNFTEDVKQEEWWDKFNGEEPEDSKDCVSVTEARSTLTVQKFRGDIELKLINHPAYKTSKFRATVIDYIES